jgi:ABC-type molybdate transport system permease subunit
MSVFYRLLSAFVVLMLLAGCGSAPTQMVVQPSGDVIAMGVKSFDVSVAQYFLDAAGFHGMSTALSETQIIDPVYLSTVNRVQKVLAHTTWPAELNAGAQAFIKSLGEFAAALEADNVTDAIEISETVHDAQHELSHSIDHWMGGVQASNVEVDPFDVSVVQCFLDSAGFHDMATALSETQTIDPAYLSTVNRVLKVLAQTTWPSELKDGASAFASSLGEFAAALDADNVAGAVELSEKVHDAQHDLSHSIDHWMGEVQAPMAEADPFDISVAQYFLDAAGFHGMATTLSETQSIDSTYLSKVNRVYKVLMHTTWSSELDTEAQALIESLGSFSQALEADNVADAVELSETVHDAQHELSHSIDHWMEEHAKN